MSLDKQFVTSMSAKSLVERLLNEDGAIREECFWQYAVDAGGGRFKLIGPKVGPYVAVYCYMQQHNRAVILVTKKSGGGPVFEISKKASVGQTTKVRATMDDQEMRRTLLARLERKQYDHPRVVANLTAQGWLGITADPRSEDPDLPE